MPKRPPPGGIVRSNVEVYIYSLQRKRDAVLRIIEDDAAKNGVPIVGPLVGNLLSILARSCRARNILEVGTATGYSAIWLAQAFGKNSGKLITIELDTERKSQAESNFRRAGLERRIEVKQGDAREIVPRLSEAVPESFDVVFLDVGDKTLYIDLLAPCAALIREGGFLLADNTLWRGFVADESDRSEETLTIREFNMRVAKMPAFDSVIVPLRDGVTVAFKRENREE
jgi:caffeoyl-CoA O-methyltransferase